MSKQTKALSPIQLQERLRGVDYPARKADLRAAAEANDAEEEVLDCIDLLPDQEFDSPAAVQEAFGQAE